MSGFIDVPRLKIRRVFPYTDAPGATRIVAAEDRDLDRELPLTRRNKREREENNSSDPSNFPTLAYGSRG
jgi:hypothetical protein